MSGVIVLVLRVILMLLLYGFLIYALYTLWRSLRTSALQVASRMVPQLTLLPIDPPGLPVQFSSPEITIGRDPHSDLLIQDDTVSTHHTRLRYHHGQWWVEDLKSTNGTFLNTVRLEIPTVIVSGDQVHVGGAGFEIQIQSTENPYEPAE